MVVYDAPELLGEAGEDKVFSWHIEQDTLKLASYSCARNMQVSCPGGVAGAKCETTPVTTAALGFASLP